MQTSRTLSADWTQVLARVQNALAQAVVQLQEREQALTAMAPQPLAAMPLNFSGYEKHLTAFAACPEQAEQNLAQLDIELKDGEDAMRQWLAQAETARRNLATWVGRTIG